MYTIKPFLKESLAYLEVRNDSNLDNAKAWLLVIDRVEAYFKETTMIIDILPLYATTKNILSVEINEIRKFKPTSRFFFEHQSKYYDSKTQLIFDIEGNRNSLNDLYCRYYDDSGLKILGLKSTLNFELIAKLLVWCRENHEDKYDELFKLGAIYFFETNFHGDILYLRVPINYLDELITLIHLSNFD